jgi:hypothetical protein
MGSRNSNCITGKGNIHTGRCVYAYILEATESGQPVGKEIGEGLDDPVSTCGSQGRFRVLHTNSGIDPAPYTTGIAGESFSGSNEAGA